MSKKGLNIHKRTDGRWEGRIRTGRKESGSLIYYSIYGKTFREVKEKMLHWNYSENIKPQSSNEEKTFNEVLDMWMENNRIKNKGATVAKYQNLIDTHIAPLLGKQKLSTITPLMINSFLQEKIENGRLDGKGGLSSSYVRSIMIVIKSAMKYAVEEGLCPQLNTPILKPSIQKTNELIILSAEEQRKLEDAVFCSNDPTKIGIFISLQTGLRIGEVCALSWNDIDFEKRILKVRHTVARVCDSKSKMSKLIIDNPKTQASYREIPISDKLVDTLNNFKQMSDSEYIVSTSKGFTSPRTYDYRYHRIIDQVGISSVNYHALRHTFATRCIEAGVDIKSLSEILGHANVAITLNTYVHSSVEMKRNQLEKMYAIV